MFWERKFEPDFYFCGRYSRPPRTAQEREIAGLLDEMMDNAQFELSRFLSSRRTGWPDNRTHLSVKTL